MTLKEKIDFDNIPKHVAVIMDGNGRWAKKKGLLRIFGHRNALQAVRDATEAASNIGVKYLTLFTFSTENWARPKDEVDGIMDILADFIKSETPRLMKNNVKLHTLGDISALPPHLIKELERAMATLQDNTGLNLILALNYSGRWDIAQASKKLCQQAKEGKINPDEFSESDFTSALATHWMPDPELMIRTSGELRISNFLLWQTAYTEIYITEVLWPDFRQDDFLRAIINYQQRERRFGKVTA